MPSVPPRVVSSSTTATGSSYPSAAPDLLADRLRRLLSDPDLAQQFGRRAHDDAGAFTYERMARAFEAAVDYAMDSARH